MSDVTLIDSQTGEVMERSFEGRNPVVWSQHSDNPGFHGEYEEWEMTALDMALGWVPALADIFDRARIQGKNVTVTVQVAS